MTTKLVVITVLVALLAGSFRSAKAEGNNPIIIGYYYYNY